MKKIREHGATIVGIVFIIALLLSVSSLLGEREKLDRNLAEMNTINEGLVKMNATLQDELWITKDALEELSAEVSDHKEANEAQTQKLNDLNKKISETDVEKEKLREEVQKLKSDNSSLQKQIEDLRSENQTLQNKVSAKAKTEAATVAVAKKKEPKVTIATSVESKPVPVSNTVTATKKEESTKTPVPSRSSTETNGKSMYMSSTAYTAFCAGCSGITRTGIDLRSNPHLKVIAVDPSVIPLGTKVHVEGYGNAIAGDTGGAIKGNKIDVFLPEHSAAIAWGRKQVKVTILK